MTDKESHIREQEDIIRNAMLNTEITSSELQAIEERAEDILDELEGEPELTELPEPDRPIQIALSDHLASVMGAYNKPAHLRAYLRAIIAETIEAGVSLDPDTCSALLAYQADKHREPLRRQRRMARSNRIYNELFCWDDCQIDHEHKQSYRDILRARPQPPKPARRRPKRSSAK
jgi:hypothetical protein